MKNFWKDIYCWSGITVWQNRCFPCFFIRFEWVLYINIFTNFKAVLMIYEINHIWTAEMKWKWRNDRHSERNLCNRVKKPEFPEFFSGFINCVHCDDHFFIFIFLPSKQLENRRFRFKLNFFFLGEASLSHPVKRNVEITHANLHSCSISLN